MAHPEQPQAQAPVRFAQAQVEVPGEQAQLLRAGRARGVRNSWLPLRKNRVLARSGRDSASALRQAVEAQGNVARRGAARREQAHAA